MIYNGIIVEEIYLFGKKTNYAVSDNGRVFNIKYNRELKNKIDSKGYYVVSLSLNGFIIDQRVHRLVATAYVPNPDDLPVVNHLDGNKLNPYYGNLEWTTPKGNAEHASRTGLLHAAKLENHGKAILTNKEVGDICELMEQGNLTQREIAKLYKVNEHVIREIRLRHNWKEISQNYEVENCKMIANPVISDETVISICEEILKNEFTIREIAKKFNVSSGIVEDILNHKKHKKIVNKYDFSHYDKKYRYPKETINEVRRLIAEGESSKYIIDKVGLEKSQKTNTFIYRQRKYVQNGNGGY